MLLELGIWGVGMPLAVATAVLLVARPWILSGKPEAHRGLWAAPLALGLGYGAAHLKLVGGPGLGIEGGMLSIAAVAAGWGVFEALVVSLPTAVRVAARFVLGASASWVLLTPLAEPQAWSFARLAGYIAIGTAASALIWSVLAQHLKRAQGVAAPLSLAALVAGSAGVVVLGGVATAGQLLGALAVGLGPLLLLSWRYPQTPLLRAAAPPLALLLVAHWAAAALYGVLPLSSLALLVLAPLALATLWLPALRRAGRVALAAASLALVVLPTGAAAVPAALDYFSESTAPSADEGADDTSGEDDYGY